MGKLDPAGMADRDVSRDEASRQIDSDEQPSTSSSAGMDVISSIQEATTTLLKTFYEPFNLLACFSEPVSVSGEAVLTSAPVGHDGKPVALPDPAETAEAVMREYAKLRCAYTHSPGTSPAAESRPPPAPRLTHFPCRAPSQRPDRRAP